VVLITMRVHVATAAPVPRSCRRQHGWSRNKALKTTCGVDSPLEKDDSPAHVKARKNREERFGRRCPSREFVQIEEVESLLWGPGGNHARDLVLGDGTLRRYSHVRLGRGRRKSETD